MKCSSVDNCAIIVNQLYIQQTTYGIGYLVRAQHKIGFEPDVFSWNVKKFIGVEIRFFLKIVPGIFCEFMYDFFINRIIPKGGH